jgi:ABC-type Fe3+-hydroxamate transport system substrate-binding protein
MFSSGLKWFIPFVCLGAIALVTVRAQPQAPLPHGDRIVIDARGKTIHIAVPFKGSVLTRGSEIPEYLEGSRDPDSLLAVTSYAMGNRVRDHIIGRIFPEVVASSRIWASKGVSDTAGPKVEIERLLQFETGVFMGWYTLAEPVERVGLPFIGFKTFPSSQKELEMATRAYTGVVGKPKRGEAIIARNNQLYRELAQELHATNDMVRPRYLYLMTTKNPGPVSVLGALNHYTRFFVPPAGVANACVCRKTGITVDAEHIISYDPDIIVLSPQNLQTPDEFMRDPRWRGLTAVAQHRVYRSPPGIDYFIAAPFWSRWLAELAHPDRLLPRSRELYRNYIEWLLDYCLSDEELDTAFAVKDNHAMVNAERFKATGSPE